MTICSNKGDYMKTAITLLLLPGFTMLLLACTQEAPDETRDSVKPGCSEG